MQRAVAYLERAEDTPAQVFPVDDVSARMLVYLSKLTPKCVDVP